MELQDEPVIDLIFESEKSHLILLTDVSPSMFKFNVEQENFNIVIAEKIIKQILSNLVNVD